MTDETDNAPLDEDATDNVETSDDDTAEDWDYFDPDEDQDTEEAPEAEATDDDEEEGEPEEEVTDEEAEPEAEPAVIDDDTAVVKLSDGTQVPLADLKSGYLRQNDYTRKTQELANERKTVEADVQRMQRITETFVDHLSGLIPDAPDTSLAYSDPNAYTAQKAQHEAAMAQVQKLIEMGNAPKEISDGMEKADRQKLLQTENDQLAQRYPETGTPEGRKQFFDEVQKTATSIGFTDEELSQVTDHRVFAALKMAARGEAAEQAKSKAKAKVAKAPPATPRKPGQGARKANGNVEAMRKLSRSGSLRDALAIDFD